MKIVFISDTHCQLDMIFSHIPEGDLLIHSGDLTYRGTEEEVRKELTLLSRLTHKHKILVAGNHDWMFQRNYSLAKLMCQEFNITYLEDSEAKINDLKIWGSPWQPEFCNWAFNLPRGEKLAERWSHIPDDTDILVTHGPPHGIGDWTTGEYGPPENVGCQDLRARVSKLNLKVHSYGHIHHGYGVYKNQKLNKGTVFINASVCNEKYRPVNAPIVLDL